jgi:hypothetical protein
MVHPIVLRVSSRCDGKSIIGYEGYKLTKASMWYIFSCPSSPIAMNSFLCLSMMVFLGGSLDGEASVIAGGMASSVGMAGVQQRIDHGA